MIHIIMRIAVTACVTRAVYYFGVGMALKRNELLWEPFSKRFPNTTEGEFPSPKGQLRNLFKLADAGECVTCCRPTQWADHEFRLGFCRETCLVMWNDRVAVQAKNNINPTVPIPSE